VEDKKIMLIERYHALLSPTLHKKYWQSHRKYLI